MEPTVFWSRTTGAIRGVTSKADYIIACAVWTTGSSAANGDGIDSVSGECHARQRNCRTEGCAGTGGQDLIVWP